jgi:hypothetical protein
MFYIIYYHTFAAHTSFSPLRAKHFDHKKTLYWFKVIERMMRHLATLEKPGLSLNCQDILECLSSANMPLSISQIEEKAYVTSIRLFQDGFSGALEP